MNDHHERFTQITNISHEDIGNVYAAKAEHVSWSRIEPGILKASVGQRIINKLAT